MEDNKTTYERITYRASLTERAGSIILRNPHEVSMFGTPCISGVQVNAEGDEVRNSKADEIRHIMQLSFVTKRTKLVVSKHYGTLEKMP